MVKLVNEVLKEEWVAKKQWEKYWRLKLAISCHFKRVLGMQPQCSNSSQVRSAQKRSDINRQIY
jgi:hypothetical protein